MPVPTRRGGPLAYDRCMREPLTLAVSQPPCVPYHVAINALTHAAVVRAAQTRVVVFPELSLTGYQLDAPAIAADDDRLRPIIEACAQTGSIALIGAPLIGDHIAMLAVDGAGVEVAYRKMYVDSSEARFTAGEKPSVLDVDGWRLGLGICKDTGIAQQQADTAALGIDAYLAGTLMKAGAEKVIQDERGARIAREHTVWVAFASFAGSTGHGYQDAAGGSGVWSPDGSLITQATTATGETVRATLG